MNPFKKTFVILSVFTVILCISSHSHAKKNAVEPEEAVPQEDPIDQNPTEEAEYRRMYYSTGVAYTHFTKKADLGTSSSIGALGDMEFRLSKIFSVGFYTYYGYLSGGGNQYFSAFNPGVKIFPLAYKSPNLEPYIYLGGHALDAVFGDSSVGKVAMGQGGFAGIGIRYMPETWPMGFELVARASFLYMQRPSNIGGRGLMIPVTGYFGIVY